jgi:hypothetical protein
MEFTIIDIDKEFEKFFDFPTEDRSQVSSVRAHFTTERA